MSNHSDNLSALQINNQTCPTVGYQTASVCVPVTVTPFAEAGKTTTYCCGCPKIIPGATECCGTVNGSCSFTITQEIRVAVPVVFGATASVGDPSVSCGCVTFENMASALDADLDAEQE